MNKLAFIFCLYLAPCLWSCQSTPAPSSDYMILDEVKYIDRFPHVFTLTDGKPIDLDIIGTLSLSIYDSLLIVTTQDESGMWSFFELPELNYLGKYLTKGNGPNELLTPPWIEEQYIFKEQGQHHAIIYEFLTGESYRMNISETIRMNKLMMSETNYLLPRVLFGFSFIDSNIFFCKEVNNSQTQQNRYILINGDKISSSNIEKLNRAQINIGEDINILSTCIKKRPNGIRIVEGGVFLNQINVYSIDDSFGKTICLGNQVDNISRIQQINRWDRLYTYLNVKVYPKFFSALYLNDTYEKYQREITKNPVIQFFDWDCNPLAEIKLDRMITTFDIDLINGSLYTLNFRTEEMYQYDISTIIEQLFY